jgi:hypothetical protein
MHQLAAEYPDSIALRQLTSGAMFLFWRERQASRKSEIIMFSPRTPGNDREVIREILAGRSKHSEPDG